ncbi:MAG: hypothetical protein JWR10_530 [Rubritepida sp.]|nr:hypothetical protein [Rubritepida sp.]
MERRPATTLLGSALVLATALTLPGTTAHSQTAPEARVSGGAATTNLLEQAQFWQQQGQPERALQSLERLLAVEPNNVDALANAVEMAAVSNQTAAAQRYLELFRRTSPQDPRLVRVTELVRLLNEDSEVLTGARALATAGRGAEAVARYRQLFRNGNVPSVLAPEYFQVLAGSSETGYREAVQQLQQRVAASPNDMRLALTYAQILTYREDSRSQGVDLLRDTARRPGAREPVRLAWRQALLWLDDDPETAARIDAYLAGNPSDAEIAAKRRAALQGAASPELTARLLGWSAMGNRQLAESERQFNQALALDPNSTEAMIGIAIIRKSQNRLPEARQILARAIAIAPDRAEELTAQLGDLSATGNRGGGGYAYRPGPTILGWRALQRGDLDGADRLARRALSSPGAARLDGEMILGQVALQRRDFVAAEMRFRNALSLRPRQQDAQTGLYFALVGQERIAEADALQREAGLTVPAGSGAARAIAMRDRALLLDNPDEAIALLRRGLETDPGNAWVKLDLARRLTAADRPEEAAAVQASLEQDTSAESSMAAALLAMDGERYGAVVALLDRVPVRLRNTDTDRLLANARREYEIRQVERQVREGRPGAVEALLALSNRRDPGFTSGPAVVRAFARLGDSLRAGMAARYALAANPQTTAQNRIDLASALLQANRMEDAAALTNPLVADPRMPAETRRQLAAVMENGAVQQSDALNARQAPEEAYQALLPNLTAQPNSVPLNMALVRLYIGANRTSEARQLVETVLQREPRNLQARLALIDVALAESRYREAEALLTETAFFYPNDTQVLLAESRIARARGDYVRTLNLVETVASRRLEHLRSSGQLVEAEATAQAISPGRGPGNTSRITDPVSVQIAQELIRARDEAATWLQAGIQIQNRTGEAGTSRLLAVTAPVEVSTPVPGIGGRVVVGLDAISLNAGRMANTLGAGRQFGTNPLLAQADFRRPNAAVDGYTFRLTYLRNNFRAEVASTPLGFANPTVVGGLEVVPRINEQFRVRVSFERRAMTDSILSYAGQRERNFPVSWGGVVRTGGRVQLEYTPPGRFGAFAGAGASMVQGNNVQSNKRIEAGIGAYYAAIRDPNQSLTLSLGAFYTGFDHNLSGFTFGQGGYFSPQQSIIGAAQAEYIARWGDWSFRTVGAVGYQNYRTSSSSVFPTNPAMQAQLVQAAASDSTLATTIPGQRSDGVTGSIFANLEYAINPNLRVGAAGRYERVGNYEDAVGLFYLRWRLDRPRTDLLPMYEGAAQPALNTNDPIQSSFREGRPEWIQLPSGATRPTW